MTRNGKVSPEFEGAAERCEAYAEESQRKPRSATDAFYAAPSPELAVALAIADHKAFTKQMPQWDYVAQLQEAERRSKAYPKLLAALEHLSTMAATRDRQAIEDALITARAVIAEVQS